MFLVLSHGLPSFMGRGCRLVYDIASHSVSSTRWSVRLVGSIVLRQYRRNSLVVEFGQQFTLRIAPCLAIAAIFFVSVQHFIPSIIERILSGFKPLLLLL